MEDSPHTCKHYVSSPTKDHGHSTYGPRPSSPESEPLRSGTCHFQDDSERSTAIITSIKKNYSGRNPVLIAQPNRPTRPAQRSLVVLLVLSTCNNALTRSTTCIHRVVKDQTLWPGAARTKRYISVDCHVINTRLKNCATSTLSTAHTADDG